MIAAARTAAMERRALAVHASERLPSAGVMLALARIEARKILLHPVFLGTTAVIGLFLLRGVVGSGGSRNNLAVLVAGLAIGLIAGGLLSVNVAAQRARRDRALELLASLPSPPEARTGAALLGALCGPVALSIVVGGIGWALLEANPRSATGVDLALAVQLPLVVAAFCTLGMALGKWIPGLVAAPVVLIAQIATGIALWVVPWVATTSSGIRMSWHLAYLISNVILWSAAALVRDRRTPLRLLTAGFALGAVVASASIQIPPGGLS